VAVIIAINKPKNSFPKMAILEVDSKMLEKMTAAAVKNHTKKIKVPKADAPKAGGKRKKPDTVTPPESGSDSAQDSAPEESPKKKAKAPKAPKAEPAPKSKKPLTEKQQAALEKRRAAEAAMTDEEKAERKRLMLEKRAATKASKAAESGEAAETKKVKKEKALAERNEKPPKWLKDYVDTAKQLDPDPETVEERAAESWKAQKKKLVTKYMRNNASMYNSIFGR